MEIVRAFKNNELNIHITIKGTEDEPLFRASDIGEVLELSNIRKNIADFTENERVSLKVSTKGGPQNITFLTEKGLKKLICNSRKANAIDLAKMLNINMIDTFYIPLETSLVYFLQEVYASEELIHQYTIEPYKIDLYFPKYSLAIECDEFFHIFQKEDDIKRELYIKEKLGCRFLRFKQGKEQMKILAKLIKKINFLIYKDNIYDLEVRLDEYEDCKEYNIQRNKIWPGSRYFAIIE